jgi:general secretion pathway protein J
MTPVRRVRAFTLVEVLVALAILAITMLLAYRATAALVDGESRLSAETTRWRSLDATFARLESDLRQAQPRTVRTGERREPAFAGAPGPDGNSALVFSRAGPEFSIEPGIAGQRIGYRLAGERLEILYWPELDNLANTQPSAFTLQDEVAAFRVEFLSNVGTWTPRWPAFGESDVPRAVRVRLTLASGEAIERWIALR